MPRSRLLGFIFLALFAASASCPKPPPERPRPALTLEQADARLRAETLRRQRVSGLYKGRLAGLKGLVVSADLDVIAESPARLHLAVRSFFDQPIQVLATDGERVTLYDAQGDGGPRFYAGPADASAARRLLGVPLSPEEVVDVLLGRVPAGATARAHAASEKGAAYTVVFDLAGGGRATVTADLDDAITHLAVADAAGRPRYEVAYDDFDVREGIRFAEKLEVRVHAAGGAEALVLSIKEAELNPEPFPDEVFQVGLPPGASFEPLPSGAGGGPLGGRSRR